MTKAAALLNIAQPALGIQVRQLEELLETPLFERHSRGVAVTPAGQVLYDKARNILGLMDETEREVRAIGQDKRERITLGVTPSIMRLVGSDLLMAANRDLPNVYFSLVEETSSVLEGGLQRGEFDLALTYEVLELPAISGTPMMVEELLLVGLPEKLHGDTTVDFASILSMDLVLAHGRDPIRRLVEQAAQDLGMGVTVAYEVQSLQATRQVVQSGLAVSVLPYGTVAQQLKTGELACRRLTDPSLKRTLFIARPSGRGVFANEEGVMKLIRSVIKQLSIDLEDLATPLPAA